MNFRGERGQSLAELALILPFMILFLAITLDVGRAMIVHMEVVHAAREGVWVASQPTGSVHRARRAVRRVLSDAGLDPSRAHVRVIIRRPGRPAVVRVTYEYRPLMPWLPVHSLNIQAREVAVRW